MKTRIIAVAVLLATALCACTTDTENLPKETAEVAEEQVMIVVQTKPDADAAEETEEQTPEAEMVILGDEQFDAYLPLLTGKRVALFSNRTGIVGDAVTPDPETSDDADFSLIPFGFDAQGDPVSYGPHILDALIEHGVNVTVVFSPEHGFRGDTDAGASVKDSVDELTGVPIRSLYGNGKEMPSRSDLDTFDVVVVDLQDVGVRYYTYYITMYYLMDACAANGKEMVILDRPNPNGFYVDGPILQEPFKSGVGELPLPVVHGMTLGELALMINKEGWMHAGKDALELTVIPCQNYTHQTKTKLICNPSPNLKDMRAIYLYPSTCYFEKTAVSVCRGTTLPFEAYGSPYLKDIGSNLFSFTPQSMEGANNPQFSGQTCYGRDLREIPLDEILDAGLDLRYLIDAYRDLKETHPEIDFFGKPDKHGYYWIDLLMGTDEVRNLIIEGKDADQVKESWADDVAAFMEQRQPYLLYE